MSISYRELHDHYEQLAQSHSELLAALEAIPMDGKNSCGHTWPHLLSCWVCKARNAITKGRKLAL